MKNKRIAVTGMIGVGKTTLCQKIGNLDGWRCHKEEVDREILNIFTDVNIKKKNQELEEFKPELLNQFHFLSETIKRDIKALYFNEINHVFDRSIIEHIYIFARTNLKFSDYALYNGMQELILNQLNWKKYDVNIVLRDSTENIEKKVEKRGRKVEQGSENKEYRKKLNEIYNSDEFIDVLGDYSEKVIIIDVAGKSENEVFEDVQKILLEI